MSVEEIINTVTSYLNQSLAGAIIENQKFDFKRDWYDLSNPQGKNEFLKDTSAMANTFGPDGFIVIGYDDKTLKFQESKFVDSKLTDTSNVPDLINKHVDRIFDLNIYDRTIDGHALSIIHIPPSIDKPHVIRNYQTFYKDGKSRDEQHKVFVRRGTTTYPANKSDYELMYYDRKNILPEYRIQASSHSQNLHFEIDVHNYNTPYQERMGNLKIQHPITITFENLGQRPVSISKVQIKLYFPRGGDEAINLSLIADVYYAPVVIAPGRISSSRFDFWIENNQSDTYTKVLETKNWLESSKKLMKSSMRLIFSTGKHIQCDFTISNE